MLLAGCGGAQGQPAAQTVVAHAVAPPPLPDASRDPLPGSVATTHRKKRASTTATGGAILSAADRQSFQQLAGSLGGAQGLAVSGLGLGRNVERVGSLNSLAAWSTAKVPIAMAVIDAGRQGAEQGDLRQAITASDNAAAMRLWASLGPPDTAAQAADAQLRRAGDQRTQIESRSLRGAGYTPFGQTAWSLTDQARFTAGLRCSAAGMQVLSLMSQVIPSQRWGLGSAGVPAQIKGGWGPGSQPGSGGGYLDRQMGIVTVHGRPLAVAIASLPSDGSHDSGTRDLTALTHWLISHADVDAQPVHAAC